MSRCTLGREIRFPRPAMSACQPPDASRSGLPQTGDCRQTAICAPHFHRLTSMRRNFQFLKSLDESREIERFWSRRCPTRFDVSRATRLPIPVRFHRPHARNLPSSSCSPHRARQATRRETKPVTDQPLPMRFTSLRRNFQILKSLDETREIERFWFRHCPTSFDVSRAAGLMIPARFHFPHIRILASGSWSLHVVRQVTLCSTKSDTDQPLSIRLTSLRRNFQFLKSLDETREIERFWSRHCRTRFDVSRATRLPIPVRFHRPHLRNLPSSSCSPHRVRQATRRETNPVTDQPLSMRLTSLRRNFQFLKSLDETREIERFWFRHCPAIFELSRAKRITTRSSFPHLIVRVVCRPDSWKRPRIPLAPRQPFENENRHSPARISGQRTSARAGSQSRLFHTLFDCLQDGAWAISADSPDCLNQVHPYCGHRLRS
jgi:hypothetical protein